VKTTAMKKGNNEQSTLQDELEFIVVDSFVFRDMMYGLISKSRRRRYLQPGMIADTRGCEDCLITLRSTMRRSRRSSTWAVVCIPVWLALRQNLDNGDVAVRSEGCDRPESRDGLATKSQAQ